MTWLEALALYDGLGIPSVLVTVTASRGSVPREAGAKMVVAADALHGTIGGGRLEHECTLAARALLAGSAPVSRDFPLGPALGQCCGGHVTVLFEPMPAVTWTVALFGAGHVGRALVRILADLPCRVRWIDSRAEAFPGTLPGNVRRVRADEPEAEVASLPLHAQALVMTHDHALDYRIVADCLRRGMAYVGLIGSATKRARFASRLRGDGLSDAGLTCPIGIGAGGKLPAEIAVSVAAQLLSLREPRPARDSRRGTVVALRPELACGACEACA